MANRGQFRKGEVGNPYGRAGKPGSVSRLAQMVKFDLREAARQYCPKALEVIAGCLDHRDAKVRLLAASIMLERGYGKPEVRADLTATHKFCIAPETLPIDEWLATKGQGYGRMLSRPPDAPVTLDAKPLPDDDSKLN
jgi:hypothetical protein